MSEHSEKLQENESSEAGTKLREEIDAIERTIARVDIQLNGKKKQIEDFEQRQADS